MALTIDPEELEREESKSAGVATIEKPNKKSKAVDDPAAVRVSAAQLLQGVEVVGENEVPFTAIRRCAENPRTSFDESLIAEMAPTIETICRLNPLTIREHTGELIDGETRHRAAELAGASKLRCKIVRCTDAQAAAIRILTSLQRRDLNPIDRAAGIRSLQEQHGLTQRQLEDLLGIKQGSISNLTRLLDLPREWQQRVISGEITSTAARELCPWVKEPNVLAELSNQLKKQIDNPNLILSEFLDHAIVECSRPIEGTFRCYDGRWKAVLVKPSIENSEELRIKNVKIYGCYEKRAFNVLFWDQLQAEAEQANRAKEASKLDREDRKVKSKTVEGVSPEILKARAAQQAEQINKRLYRYKIAWLQDRLIETVKTFDESDFMKFGLLFSSLEGYHHRSKQLVSFFELGRDFNHLTAANVEKLWKIDVEPFWSTAHELVYAWIAAPFEGWHAPLKPELIEVLAAAYGIDFDDQWSASCAAEDSTVLREFLELLSKSQLSDLILEWKLTGVEKTKREETITAIDEIGKGSSFPKLLDRVKAVNL